MHRQNIVVYHFFHRYAVVMLSIFKFVYVTFFIRKQVT
jgi:hypothetical protein